MAKHSETRKYMVKNGKIYTAKARKTSLNNKEMNDFGVYSTMRDKIDNIKDLQGTKLVSGISVMSNGSDEARLDPAIYVDGLLKGFTSSWGRYTRGHNSKNRTRQARRSAINKYNFIKDYKPYLDEAMAQDKTMEKYKRLVRKQINKRRFETGKSSRRTRDELVKGSAVIAKIMSKTVKHYIMVDKEPIPQYWKKPGTRPLIDTKAMYNHIVAEVKHADTGKIYWRGKTR